MLDWCALYVSFEYMQILMSVSKVITTVQSMLSVKTSMGDSTASVMMDMREMGQHAEVITIAVDA